MRSQVLELVSLVQHERGPTLVGVHEIVIVGMAYACFFASQEKLKWKSGP